MTCSLYVYVNAEPRSGQSWWERHTWWNNINKAVREKFEHGNQPGTLLEYRDQLLKKHNAEYRDYRVYFDSEQDLMFFLLRWA